MLDTTIPDMRYIIYHVLAALSTFLHLKQRPPVFIGTSFCTQSTQEQVC